MCRSCEAARAVVVRNPTRSRPGEVVRGILEGPLANDYSVCPASAYSMACCNVIDCGQPGRLNWAASPGGRFDSGVARRRNGPIRLLLEELKTARRKTCPFRTVPDLRDDFRELPDTPPQWVRPIAVVEVEYRQRLQGGLRHAALNGIRPDKRPRLSRRYSRR
jgi:hypothetical protein